MAIEREVPANCLANTVNARCTKVGVDIPELDIKDGDNLDYALQQVGTLVSGSEESTESTEFINSNLYCLGGSGNSICATKIVSRSLLYSIKPTLSGLISFSWDLTSIRYSLPKGYSVISVSVVANSANATGPLLNSSSTKAVTSFQTANYPITVDVKMRIDTECGQIELAKTLSLFNTAHSGDKIAIMDLNDFTAQTIQDITQDEYNELIAGEVCLIKDRLVLVEESKNYDADIVLLESRVGSLESVNIGDTVFSQINCLGGVTSSITLTNYLADLNARNCALQETVETLSETVAGLQTQINNL